MNNRDYGIWFLPIFAALAIYLPVATGARPQPTVSTSLSSEKKVAPPKKTPGQEIANERMLARFLGTDDPDTIIKELKKYEITFLVATIPDPTDSSLGYLFDRQLAAIQLAGQSAGYTPDRFDLPWLDKEEQAVQQGKAIARYEQDRLGIAKLDEEIKLPLRQREPGVVLFRGRDEERKRDKLLLIFLIGETPTAGIHKSAFQDALEQIRTICEALGIVEQPECQTLPLLAPTFSGAADSLVLALERWKEHAEKSGWSQQFTIVSGSATAIGKDKIIKLRNARAVYQATVSPDEVTWPAFLNYLQSSPINAKATHIARLVEGTTGYGQASREAGVLTLIYPFHISQLRKAAEKAKGTAKETPTAAPSLRPRNLRLSLEETNEGRDVIPPFSTFDTFSVELVISNILSTISREGVRYLGILSTDVRDQIFLAQEIRKHAPDVVLFTLSSDLIYLHSDVNLDFQGMLLISTYPLFSRNQLWTYPFAGKDLRLQFPNDSTQGVYNATLALLGEPELMLEYGWPFDYGQKAGEPRTPPVWLSAVGKNDIWPVKLLGKSPTDSRDYLVPGTLPSPGRDFARPLVSHWFISLRTLFVLLGLSILFFVTSLSLLAEFAPRWFPRMGTGGVDSWRNRMSGVLKYLGDAALQSGPERHRYLFALTLVIVILSFVTNRLLLRVIFCNPVTNVCGIELEPTEDRLLFHIATLVALAFLEAPAVIAGLAILKTTPSTESAKPPAGRIRTLSNPVASAPMLILLLTVGYAIQLNGLPPVEALFFYLRTLNPQSGLSPLLPLLFVGVGGLLWLVGVLHRLRLLEEIPTPYLRLDSDSFAGVGQAESRVKKLLTSPWLSLPASYTLLLLVGVPCAYLFLFSLTPALERSLFYWLFGAVFVYVYVAFSLSLWRTLHIWRATRELIRRLSTHPMHRAYGSLLEKFPRTPRLSLSNPSNIISTLEFSLDQARTLLRLPPEAPEVPAARWEDRTLRARFAKAVEPIKSEVAAAETNVLDSHREDAAGNWKTALLHRNAAQGRLSAVASLLVEVCKPEWRSTDRALRADEQSWLLLVEHFLAGRITSFLHHIFLHLKNLLLSVTAGLLLMLLAVVSYPFQPSNQLLMFNWVIILSTAVVVLTILVQINRNSTLSLLTGTKPGQISWNQEFIVRILLYGVVPILALLGAQFPEALQGILSWVSASQGGR